MLSSPKYGVQAPFVERVHHVLWAIVYDWNCQVILAAQTGGLVAFA